MYVIENGNTKPQHNLALEEILCRKAAREGTKFFMLWQNEPSIIVGRFQNTLEEINTAFVEENKIHVVRRNSGGGAVYHDLGNLNFTFIVNGSEGLADFKIFLKPITEYLCSIGLEAEFSGDSVSLNQPLTVRTFFRSTPFRRRLRLKASMGR